MHESWQRLMDQLDEVRVLGPVNPRIYRGYLEPISRLFRDLVLFEEAVSPTIGFAHYTSWEKTMAIMECIDEAAIRLYNLEIANDPREGDVDRQEWRGLEEQAIWLDKNEDASDMRSQGSAYGCSFSSGTKRDHKHPSTESVGDNLNFWRLYGNNGDGCSFMIPFRHENMYRVRYYNSEGHNVDGVDGQDEEVLKLFEQLLNIGKEIVEADPPNNVIHFVVRNLRRLRTAYRHLAKNHYYKDEQEWRMIRVAPESNDIHFDVADSRLIKRYINGDPWNSLLMSRSVITIGPCVRNQAAALAYVEDRKRKLGLNATVVVSDKEYRSV